MNASADRRAARTAVPVRDTCSSQGRVLDVRAILSASATTRPCVPRKLPLHPAHPERICWGCDKYCAADDLRCGNGTDRTQHPSEIFGDDWDEHTLVSEPDDVPASDASVPAEPAA